MWSCWEVLCLAGLCWSGLDCGMMVLLLLLLLLLLEVPSASSGPRMVPPKTTRSPRMPNFDCSRAELCCVLPG